MLERRNTAHRFGYDYVPGNLAAGLAVDRAGAEASRVDVAYFMTDPAGRRNLRTRVALPSTGTMDSILALVTEPGYAYRSGRIVTERVARSVGGFTVAGRRLEGVSIGAVEQFALPRSYPQLLDVNVYLGWFDPLSRLLQASSWAADGPARRRLVGGVVSRLSGTLLSRRPDGASAEVRDSMRALVVAVAYDGAGHELTRVVLRGPEPYRFTGDLLAWGAQQAMWGNLGGIGAVGPIEAFGLDDLRDGCAEAGLVER